MRHQMAQEASEPMGMATPIQQGGLAQVGTVPEQGHATGGLTPHSLFYAS